MNSTLTNRTVEQLRPPKEFMDPMKPYLFLNEEEMQDGGELKSVNTIFLTNRECPFKCIMCDLWRHTLDETTPEGAIPAQIEYALERLPAATVIKLYNSGNFFDGKAIPRTDYKSIAELLREYDHVIVENHPNLIGGFITGFRDLLSGSFEIAMGLESIHPDVLPRLNKQITATGFRKATEYLTRQQISVRAFILLNPPFLKDGRENVKWCLKSIEFAFDCGASVCSVIPVRDGNGIMDKLREKGEFVPPKIQAIEEVIERALTFKRGRVFCDLWDLKKFRDCNRCFPDRKSRLHRMNQEQRVLPEITCHCLGELQ